MNPGDDASSSVDNPSAPTSDAASSSSFGLLDLFVASGSAANGRFAAASIRTPEVAWEFLTVQDLVNLRCVSKSYRERLEENFEYLYCRDGRDYRVPYPGFPGLLRHGDKSSRSRHTLDAHANGNSVDDHHRAGLYPHQLASLRAMHHMEESSRSFGALRGGVLGDAPGLGKTITTLALIAATAGRRPVNPPEFWDASRLREGWREFGANPVAERDLRRCLRGVLHRLTRSEREEILPPFGQNQFPTPRDYERRVRSLLRGKSYPLATRSEWERVRQNLLDLRVGLDKRNRKLLKSREGQRLLLERKLVPTTATLLVVPDALFEHWFQQIREHLYLPLFADSDDGYVPSSSSNSNSSHTHQQQQQYPGQSSPIARGVVYLDGLGDLADVTMGKKALENTRALKEPVLYADQLSGYLIVVVTFSRCRREVRSGHAMAAAEDGNENDAMVHRGRTATRKRPRRRRQSRSPSPAPGSLEFHRSPLLRLRWLRLMVDEGHQLETDEDLADFIHQVAAERRWVVSGTPVTGNEDNPKYNSVALDQLQRILYFLRHPRYGVSNERDVVRAWETEVKKPFLSKQSRENLLKVLKEIMVMHRKEDLKLPEPIFSQIEREIAIPMEEEAKIVTDHANALDRYLHSPAFQSLVDDAMASYAIEALQKARTNRQKLCRNDPFHSASRKDDRRPIKGVVYSSDNKDLLSVADLILRKLPNENVSELYGDASIGDMSAELERFRHGTRMFRACPVCGGENPMIAGRCQNDLMEVVSTTTGERFLVEPERVLGTRNVPLARLNGEPMRNYPVNRKFWRVGDVLVVDIREFHPVLPKRQPLDIWKRWGAPKCELLAASQQYLGMDWYFGPLPDNLGADQDRPLCMEVTLMKWQKCGVYHSASRWYQGPKFLDAKPSKRQEDTFLLCLDANLAHGLDLSFVTHIFLLEPINDAALLEQVTSRAHRLGATGPVRIETINVFYKCSEKFQQQVTLSLSRNKERETGEDKKKRKNSDKFSMILNNQNRKGRLTKIVCHYCYRQFDSYPLAEEHERTLCLRNPDNTVVADRYHLSSVYREIRPPLPMVSS